MNKEDLMQLPIGFRFHPTDEEIVLYYLIPKAMNSNFNVAVISQADFNNCEPWNLPKITCIGDTEQFYYWKRDWKYSTGLRTNRATKAGYWKATGKDREIYKGAMDTRELVGMKKTLVFYIGRAPKGEKTNWIMHEYRLLHQFCQASKNIDEWVVSRVFDKSTSNGKGDIYTKINSGNNISFSPFRSSPTVSTGGLLIKDENGSLPPLVDHPSADAPTSEASNVQNSMKRKARMPISNGFLHKPNKMWHPSSSTNPDDDEKLMGYTDDSPDCYHNFSHSATSFQTPMIFQDDRNYEDMFMSTKLGSKCL